MAIKDEETVAIDLVRPSKAPRRESRSGVAGAKGDKRPADCGFAACLKPLAPIRAAQRMLSVVLCWLERSRMT